MDWRRLGDPVFAPEGFYSGVYNRTRLYGQTGNDGVYAVPGFLLVAGNSGEGRFVGYRPGTEVRWNIDRHAYLQADYGVFYAGKFLREASPGRNINYLELWAGYKF